MLDPPVFQRVETDDCEPPACLEQVRQEAKCLVEVVQFVVTLFHVPVPPLTVPFDVVCEPFQ